MKCPQLEKWITVYYLQKSVLELFDILARLWLICHAINILQQRVCAKNYYSRPLAIQNRYISRKKK